MNKRNKLYKKAKGKQKDQLWTKYRNTRNSGE